MMVGKRWDGEPSDDAKRIASQSALLLDKLRRDIKWSMMIYGSAFVDVDAGLVVDPLDVRRSWARG